MSECLGVISVVLSVVSTIGMVVCIGCMIFTAWRHHKLISLYPYAVFVAVLGLSNLAGGRWAAAGLCFALVFATIGWQQALTRLDAEMARNRRIRDAGLIGVYMTPFDP